jgi:hypothetical protein
MTFYHQAEAKAAAQMRTTTARQTVVGYVTSGLKPSTVAWASGQR